MRLVKKYFFTNKKGQCFLEIDGLYFSLSNYGWSERNIIFKSVDTTFPIVYVCFCLIDENIINLIKEEFQTFRPIEKTILCDIDNIGSSFSIITLNKD